MYTKKSVGKEIIARARESAFGRIPLIQTRTGKLSSRFLARVWRARERETKSDECEFIAEIGFYPGKFSKLTKVTESLEHG